MTYLRTKTQGAGIRQRSEARRVYQALEELCMSLLPGDKVPTHTELMRQFEASERTVLRALEELRQSGRVVRRVGSGTFIADDSASNHDPIINHAADSRTIIAIARPSDPYIIRSLELLVQQAEAINLSLICRLFTPQYNPFPLPPYLPYSELSGPRGYVVLGSDLAPFANHLREGGHRVVLFGTPTVDTTLNIPYIHGDHEQGAYLATRHLIELGHRRIAFVHEDENVLRHTYRWRGHQDALAEARAMGNDVPEKALTSETYSAWLTDIQLVRDYFQRPDSPTALIAWNDGGAILLLTILLSAGLRVPEDVSVIGYDNLSEGQLIYPTLTTIDHGIERQMRLALRMLTQPEPPAPSQVLVTPTLIERQSTAAPQLEKQRQ